MVPKPCFGCKHLKFQQCLEKSSLVWQNAVVVLSDGPPSVKSSQPFPAWWFCSRANNVVCVEQLPELGHHVLCRFLYAGSLECASSKPAHVEVPAWQQSHLMKCLSSGSPSSLLAALDPDLPMKFFWLPVWLVVASLVLPSEPQSLLPSLPKCLAIIVWVPA